MFIIWGSIIDQHRFDRPHPRLPSQRLFTSIRGSFLHNVLNSEFHSITIQMGLLPLLINGKSHPLILFWLLKEHLCFGWMGFVQEMQHCSSIMSTFLTLKEVVSDAEYLIFIYSYIHSAIAKLFNSFKAKYHLNTQQNLCNIEQLNSRDRESLHNFKMNIF